MSTEAAHTKRMKVGVVLPMGENPESGHTSRYTEIRERALQIEDSGFDSIWVYDHLLFHVPGQPVSGIWEIWTLASALAEATERVLLGTLVVCTAFRNPAVLAKMATTLDDVSGGRLILGLGAGWHQPEFDAFGIAFDHRVDRFEEAIAIIAPLLREGRVDFRGKYYQAANCEMHPRGPSSKGMPILIAGSRPRMLGLTARYADMWNTAWLGRPEALAARREPFDAACRDAGREIEVTVGVNVNYSQEDESEKKAVDEGKALGGSPSDVAAALKGYEDLGVSHAICALNDTGPQAIAWLADAFRMFRAAKIADR